MQYQISSDNIDMSPSMEALTKEKFSRIESRLADMPEGSCSARIVLNTAPEGMFEVKIKLNASGKEYFSDETDYTLESALVRAVEEILIMMERDKDLRKRHDMDMVERFEEI